MHKVDQKREKRKEREREKSMSTRDTPTIASPPIGVGLPFLKINPGDLVAGVKNKFDFSQPSVAITRPKILKELTDMVAVDFEASRIKSKFYKTIYEKINKSLEKLKGIGRFTFTEGETSAGHEWRLLFHSSIDPGKLNFPVLSEDGNAIEWTDSTREFLDWLMESSLDLQFLKEENEWNTRQFYEYRPLLSRKNTTSSPTTVYYLGYKTSPERQDGTSKVA